MTGEIVCQECGESYGRRPCACPWRVRHYARMAELRAIDVRLGLGKRRGAARFRSERRRLVDAIKRGA